MSIQIKKKIEQQHGSGGKRPDKESTQRKKSEAAHHGQKKVGWKDGKTRWTRRLIGYITWPG